MTDEYIDPNSGRAPQPGGYAAAVVATDQVEDESQVDEATEEETPTEETEQPETPTEEEQPEQEQPAEEEEQAPATEEGEGEQPTESEKDYSELLDQNLGPIQEYLQEHPDELEAVKAAEVARAGDDARKGITEYSVS